MFRSRSLLYPLLLLILADIWQPMAASGQSLNLFRADNNAILRTLNLASLPACPNSSQTAPPSALKTCAVMRDGFHRAGDGGAAVYYWSASACSISGGDNGSQVAPDNGVGCWLADMSQPMDVRVWGAECNGTANDSVALNAAVAAAATVIIPPLVCVGKNILWSNTGSSSLVGTPNKSVLKLDDSAKVTDYLAWYKGTGPLNVSGVTFQCPIYDFSAPVVPPGRWGLRVQPPSGGDAQMSKVTLRDVSAIGCDQQFMIFSVSYVDIDHIFLDRPYSYGLNIGDYGNQGSPPRRSDHIRVNNLWGRGAGSYCATFLGYQSKVVAPTPGMVDVEAHDLNCNGAGLFQRSKMCFDLAGNSYDKIIFEGSGTNCWAGGIEVKTSNQNTFMRPNFAGNVNLKFTYFSNFDQGTAVWLPVEVSSGGVATPHKQMKIENYATFTKPEAYSNGFSYGVGAVVSARHGAIDNTYYALNDGLSAATGSGPSCSGTVNSITTCQDGDVWWLYIQATPTGDAQKIIAMEIEAVTDVTAHIYAQQTAYGVLLLPRGNQPMSRVQLYYDGTTTRSCLFDTSTSTDWAKIGTIDRLTLKDWNCRTTGRDAPIRIGYNYGTNYINYFTNLTIDGGVFWSDADYYAFQTNNSVLTSTPPDSPAISGRVIGAAQFKGGRGAFLINNNVDLEFAPGATLETKCPSQSTCSGGSAIQGGAISSGTMSFMGPTHVKSDLAPNVASFATVTRAAGSTLTVGGQFIRGLALESPAMTQAGSPGDKVLNLLPTVAVPNGWSCTTGGNPCNWTAY